MKPRISLLMTSALTLLLLSTAATAADKEPERKVEGSTVTSDRDPAVKVTLPATAQYVGAARWDLYGIADAELHVFVEADAQKRIQRLYWVQFEGYLPDNTHTYKYPFLETVTLAGHEFDVHGRYSPTDVQNKPGSERERVVAMLGKAGYQMPKEQLNLRLIHLPDEAKRKELMIVYAEDMALSGTSVEKLNQTGGQATWEEVKKGLIDRAKERIQLSDLASSSK
jgi:hypothetical protein